MGFKWWKFNVRHPPKPINISTKDLIKLIDNTIVAKLKSITASDTIKLSDNITLQTMAGGLIKPSIGILGHGANIATSFGNTSNGVNISKSLGMVGSSALIANGLGYATDITISSGGG